jgi:hypothetical protein
MIFGDETPPSLIVDPDGTIHYKCPVGDQNNLIRQWIDENQISGLWYDGIFYFANKEDRNVVRLFL